MKIFGKKGCDENRNFSVRINLVGEFAGLIGQQLTEEEATEIYEKLKAQFQDKRTETIECFYNDKGCPTTEIYNKANIVSIEMYEQE